MGPEPPSESPLERTLAGTRRGTPRQAGGRGPRGLPKAWTSSGHSDQERQRHSTGADGRVRKDPGAVVNTQTQAVLYHGTRTFLH